MHIYLFLFPFILANIFIFYFLLHIISSIGGDNVSKTVSLTDVELDFVKAILTDYYSHQKVSEFNKNIAKGIIKKL